MKPILTFVLFVIVVSIYAQNNYNGISVTVDSSGTDITFETEDIVSDFGPRMICNHNFHGGIDYTSNESEDRGFLIKALEGGTIYRVGGANGTKYVLIEGEDEHNFAYMHLFDTGNLPRREGEFEIDILHSYSDDQDNIYAPCIIRTQTVGNNTVRTVYAACPNNDCDNSYMVYPWTVNGEITNDTVYATNTVDEGDAIGTLGSSGLGINNTHLHLQKHNVLAGINAGATYSKANLSDPLEFVEHQGPEYEISIHHEGQNANVDSYPEGIQVQYPGTEETSFMVRPSMPDLNNQGGVNHGNGPNRYFFNNTMNVDEVKSYIKVSHEENPAVIIGPNYEARVSMGGRVDHLVPYPVMPRSILTTQQFNGNWNRTGIDARAYNTDCGTTYSRQWDDFYYADFVTRIHKDDPMDGATTATMIADCPDDARYPDGSYELFAEVTDVRGA